MKRLLIMLALMLATTAIADKKHHHGHYYEPVFEPQVVNVPLIIEPEIQVQNDLNTTNQTAVNNITDYQYNDCQGVAIAMAAANNQMYMGTSKPQLSGGMGECNGDWAGSLMFGMKPCDNCPILNGNWAFDDRVNAFGFGATFILR